MYRSAWCLNISVFFKAVCVCGECFETQSVCGNALNFNCLWGHIEAYIICVWERFDTKFVCGNALRKNLSVGTLSGAVQVKGGKTAC